MFAGGGGVLLTEEIAVRKDEASFLLSFLWAKLRATLEEKARTYATRKPARDVFL